MRRRADSMSENEITSRHYWRKIAGLHVGGRWTGWRGELPHRLKNHPSNACRMVVASCSGSNGLGRKIMPEESPSLCDSSR